jgi:hypothetical protein
MAADLQAYRDKLYGTREDDLRSHATREYRELRPRQSKMARAILRKARLNRLEDRVIGTVTVTVLMLVFIAFVGAIFVVPCVALYDAASNARHVDQQQYAPPPLPYHGLQPGEWRPYSVNGG